MSKNIWKYGLSWLWQLSALLAVVYGIYWLADNTINNLARQGTTSGFAFLGERAGFGISQTLIAYSEDSSYGRVLVVGILNTILVAFVSIVLATLIGFLVGIGRLSENWIVSRLSAVYIEVFRNIPLLLQIMFWYFGVLQNLPPPRRAIELFGVAFLSNRGFAIPSLTLEAGSDLFLLVFFGFVALIFIGRKWQWRRQMSTGQRPSLAKILLPLFAVSIGICYAFVGWPFALDLPTLAGFNFKGGMRLIPEFVSLTVALSVYTAAFIAEIVRAGIMSVDHGQSEAARALGLPRATTLRLITIPLALRVIIPMLTSQYLNLTKNSSLAVAIAYPDVVSVFAGTTLNQVGQAVEIVLITMVIYLVLSLITSFILNMYNARIALQGVRQ